MKVKLNVYIENSMKNDFEKCVNDITRKLNVEIEISYFNDIVDYQSAFLKNHLNRNNNYFVLLLKPSKLVREKILEENSMALGGANIGKVSYIYTTNASNSLITHEILHLFKMEDCYSSNAFNTCKHESCVMGYTNISYDRTKGIPICSKNMNIFKNNFVIYESDEITDSTSLQNEVYRNFLLEASFLNYL